MKLTRLLSAVPATPFTVVEVDGATAPAPVAANVTEVPSATGYPCRSEAKAVTVVVPPASTFEDVAVTATVFAEVEQ